MTIAKFPGGDAVMSTADLRELINEARVDAGEAKIRNDQFITKVEDELAGELGGCKKIAHPQSGVLMDCYDLTRDQCMLVSMRESKAVRRKVVAKLNALAAAAERRLPENLPDALRFAADLAEEKAVLALENQQQAKKIEALEHLFMPGETVPQFAKRLNGVNSQLVLAYLHEIKWIFNAESNPDHSPKYRVYAMARDKHWLTEKPFKVSGEGITTFIRYAPVMLEEGTKKLFDLYMAEKLPMKKTWDGQFFYEKFNPEKPL
ncbi:phage antirepressor protein [Pseudomonas brenneri]|uniref:phage antirepressor protein n=1 Tax=Pseudomonas brenneri TaxID=129817 RepID=UPI0028D4F9E0|nr:phage antirepressor protein [Pseudomonas brenneri]